MLSLFVPGHPVTQGSVRAYPGRNGGAFVVQGGSKERRAKLDDWRRSIRDVTVTTILYDNNVDRKYPLDGPVHVVAHFGMPKPAHYPKKRRTWPISARSGDIDKLLRAVLDALTGIVWHDDSQVVAVAVSKDWDTTPGLRLTITGGEESDDTD